MASLQFARGAASALAYIDTAVAVATFLFSERVPATLENIRSFFRRTNREPPPEFRPEEALQLVALLVIDPELLRDLGDIIKRAIDAYRVCLRAASRPQESDACDRRAERDICDALNRVRNRNNGVLPTEFLEDQWASYGCVRVV